MATPVPSASRRPTRTFKDNVRPKSQILIDEKLEAFKDLIEINDDDQEPPQLPPKIASLPPKLPPLLDVLEEDEEHRQQEPTETSGDYDDLTRPNLKSEENTQHNVETFDPDTTELNNTCAVFEPIYVDESVSKSRPPPPPVRTTRPLSIIVPTTVGTDIDYILVESPNSKPTSNAKPSANLVDMYDDVQVHKNDGSDAPPIVTRGLNKKPLPNPNKPPPNRKPTILTNQNVKIPARSPAPPVPTAVPTPTFVSDANGYDDEDLYEEIERPKPTPSAPPPGDLYEPPPPPPSKGGSTSALLLPTEDPVDSIYAAVDEDLDVPPPIMAYNPPTSPTSDIVGDHSSQTSSPPPTTDPGLSESATSGSGSKIAKGKSVKKGGASIKKKKSFKRKKSWFGKGKKVLELEDEYTEFLTTMIQKSTSDEGIFVLMQVKATVEGTIKTFGDLAFDNGVTIDIVEMDKSPPGKWMGKLDDAIGYVSCNDIQIDAGALKQMLDLKK